MFNDSIMESIKEVIKEKHYAIQQKVHIYIVKQLYNL